MSVHVYLTTFIILFIAVSAISVRKTFSFIKKDFSEQIKLDVTPERMAESENNISKFLEKNNIKADGSILEIARILNVEQGDTEKGLDTQAHLKEESETGKKVVTFKDGLSEEEKKFVFAHEIAHLLNGDSIPVTRPYGRNKSEIEQYADYTAAALLMPFELVEDFLMKNNYQNSSVQKRTVLVRKLCKEYGVTEIIALRRIKEVYTLKNLKKD